MKFDESPSSSGPLAGIRVIELGSLIAAPFAARMLGDFGAEVIKIEGLDGDPLRKWRVLHDGTSLWWHLQSRNKKVIGLDLKSPEAVGIVRKLVTDADIVIENFRPGGLEKLGLGWADLSALNPNLIMVRISGFGQTGPYRDRPGFGAIGEAMGGIRYTTGAPDRPPARVGVSLGDSLASLHGVIGALMGVLHVKSGRGKGQVVDVSLYESVFNLMESIVPEHDLYGVVRERSGGRLPGISPSNTYRTRDGAWLVIAGNSDAIFRRLMRVIGRPELGDDERLRHNDGRVEHEELIDNAISQWAGSCDLDAACDALNAADIPNGRIYTVEDIMADPHYRERQMIQTDVLPDGTTVQMPGIMPKLTETPGSVRWLGQAMGAHTDSVLGDLGFAASQISDMRNRGVVR